MKDFVLDRIGSMRERLGTAGFALAVIALVVALAGGAYAAGGGLTGKQKKEVTKIAKKYAGKNGANGANGAPGANGTNGTNGKDGAPGQNGAPGESVHVTAYEGEECPTEEGAELSNGTGTAFVCAGEEGEPWTAGGTLPPGATETGSWSMFMNKVTDEPTDAAWTGIGSISFSIPLGGELAASNVIVNPVSGSAEADCENSNHSGAASVSNPEAKPGFLCVFEANVFNQGGLNPAILKSSTGFPTPGAVQTGAVLFKSVSINPENEPPPPPAGWGTWAVTG